MAQPDCLPRYVEPDNRAMSQRSRPSAPPRVPVSSVGGIVWPAFPGPEAARILALAHQLEQSQWWSTNTLVAMQLRQAEALLAHAAATVPFYGSRLNVLRGVRRGDLTPETWRTVPLTRRGDWQAAGNETVSRRVPVDHGSIREVQTTGSMGAPVTVRTSTVTGHVQAALNLRLHLWHDRNLSGNVAAIIAMKPTATPADETAVPWAPGYGTGRMTRLDVRTPIPGQLDWLAKADPDDLLTYPSNLAALVAAAPDARSRMTRLQRVATLGEVLTDGQRAACEAAWGVPVIDVYSAQEVGLIALQCPGHTHYLVQSESLIVEVLDDRSVPCGPGDIGRIVVTDLHNFATPLIRYEIGDFAEVGAPCPTGRGLPVLRRIAGRRRNMLTLPSGERYWPSFPAELFLAVAPVRQVQLVQTANDTIRVRLAMETPLTTDQRQRLRAALIDRLRYPFRLEFEHVERIPAGPGGKYEDFRSEI